MRTLLLILSVFMFRFMQNFIDYLSKWIYLTSKVKRLVIIITDIFIAQREYLKDIIPTAIFTMIITIL